MSLVIVTQNQYILANKIHHITMDERIDYHDIRVRGKYHSVKDRFYQITVIYSQEPVNTGNGMSNRGDEQRECCVIVRGAVDAHKAFKNLIQQIREQSPDQLYLDKALERMLEGLDMASLELEDKERNNKAELHESNTSTKGVRRSGKAKGRGKTVLRKLKKRR